MNEKEKSPFRSSNSSGWEGFDMDKFFKETDAVGKILEEKRKAGNE